MIAPETLDVPVGELTYTTLVAGPTDGPPVLCLHGFPDLPETFLPMMGTLAEAGYRALAPTARGYAPACVPADGDLSIAAIAADVLSLLDELGIDRCHVFGHDWGAVAAYAIGARAPDRFASLGTLAVPPLSRPRATLGRVPRQLLRSWYQFFFQLPGLSDWLTARDDYALLRRLCATWSPGFTFDDAAWAARRAAFARPGVWRSMLRYYRCNLFPLDLLLDRGIFAPSTVPVPTLAISGRHDGCMDTRLWDHVPDRLFPAGLQVERVDGGHFAHLERPAEVDALVLDWIARHPLEERS